MAWIINTDRKRDVKRNSYLLQMRYTATDAKDALREYLKQNPLLVKTPMTKAQVMEIFYKNTLEHFQKKSVKSLAEFLFDQSTSNDYVVRVPKIWTTDPDEYIVNPEIINIKPGPKSKKK